MASAQAASGTRCNQCGAPMLFDDWAHGKRRCDECAEAALMSQPAATFVRGPASARTQSNDSYADQERLIDELPESLFDEIIAALEAESARIPDGMPAPKPLLQDIVSEIGIGTSPREWQYGLWGFAVGFTLNVGLAKYAQMSSGAPMGDFIGPILFGGVVAGAAAGLIGWAIAKLREH